MFPSSFLLGVVSQTKALVGSVCKALCSLVFLAWSRGWVLAASAQLQVDRPLLSPQGVVRVGAVDADKHQSLGGQYGVQGFPTIKIFGSNKNRPEDYQGKDFATSSPWLEFPLEQVGGEEEKTRIL